MVLTYPESTGPRRAKDGDNDTRRLHDQEEYGAALIRNKVHHVMTVTEWRGEENKETNPRNILTKIPVDVNHAKALSKCKSHQPGVPAQNSPVKNKSIRHIRRSTHYLPQLSKVRRVPSDFEGSGYGYADLQGRGDKDISPFSGDGQPFEDISGKEEAFGLDLESTDRQTGLFGPGEAETVNTDTRGLGPNEIPEGKEGGGDTLSARAGTSKEAGEAAVSLVEGSSDITGSTSFRELPGKEGSRVDTGSQNAHQGKIELHYPNALSKGQSEGGSAVVTESATHNEIPKHGKGGTRKATELSGRNQEALSEKHRFSSKGKSQGLIIPSHGLDNEIKNEIGSHCGPHNEENMITHSRKNSYVPHGQNDSVRSKGGSQRQGPWGYRRHPSNKGFSTRKRASSSESSDSSSSSESGGH
ncbi:Matrix extracellular phosphoglycoprotein [Heterocephalus glaber]|nr:Matrix extracellular phosphoglycoprotein [Heterocephalus glaber]